MEWNRQKASLQQRIIVFVTLKKIGTDCVPTDYQRMQKVKQCSPKVVWKVLFGTKFSLEKR